MTDEGNMRLHIIINGKNVPISKLSTDDNATEKEPFKFFTITPAVLNEIARTASFSTIEYVLAILKHESDNEQYLYGDNVRSQAIDRAANRIRDFGKTLECGKL